MGLIHRLYSKLLLHRWNIGFVDLSNANVFNDEKLKIRWVKHNFKDRWFADPFILKQTNTEIEVLVEEFYDPINRGRISKLTIDKSNFRLKRIKVLLELETHLSFPAILRIGEEVFVYPENSAAGHLMLYRYQNDSESLEPVGKLVEEPLTDAIITYNFEKPTLFSTRLPFQNKDELLIYQSDEQQGPFLLKYSMIFKENTARSAGRIFEFNGKIIRPSQNCNDTYGGGLVFYELTTLEDGTFSFHEFKRYLPHSWMYNLGMHTFDSEGTMGVVDGRGYRKPLVGRLLFFFRNLVIK